MRKACTGIHTLRIRTNGRFAGVLAAAFLTAALPVAGQEPGPRVPTIQVDVQQVVVPVVVTDKKGHHAAGLKASDFRIFEDGVQQEIVAFGTETSGMTSDPETLSAGAGPQTAANGASKPPGRTYILCFDTLHSTFANFGHVRDALESLFRKERDTGAQFVLVDLGRQLRVIQTATPDPAKILAKIQSSTFASVFHGSDAQAMAIEVNNMRLRMEQFCRKCPCGPSARSATCYPERQDLRQEVNARAEQTAVMTHQFLQSLKGLLVELGRVPTDRTLLLISDGFSLQPGEEFYSVAGAYLPNYSEFKFPTTERMEPALLDALDVAVKRNIRIHSIDSRGLSVPGFSGGGSSDASNSGSGGSSARNRGGSMLSELDRRQASVEFQNGSGLSQLAAATGGIYFHQNNDMLKNLRTAIVDGREYYVLVYVPKRVERDGALRKISVTVSDKSVSVRTREGYRAR